MHEGKTVPGVVVCSATFSLPTSTRPDHVADASTATPRNSPGNLHYTATVDGKLPAAAGLRLPIAQTPRCPAGFAQTALVVPNQDRIASPSSVDLVIVT